MFMARTSPLGQKLHSLLKRYVDSVSHMNVYIEIILFPYLLSKVNIHISFSEHLLTLSPTLFCV